MTVVALCKCGFVMSREDSLELWQSRRDFLVLLLLLLGFNTEMGCGSGGGVELGTMRGRKKKKTPRQEQQH